MSAPRWALISTAAVITVLTLASAVGAGQGMATGLPSDRRLAAILDGHQRPPEVPAESGEDGASERTADRELTDSWRSTDDDSEDRGQRAKKVAEPQSAALPVNSGTGKRIVFDESAQRVWLVNAKGEVARTYLVSGARDADLLKPGHYQVYSKSRDAVSFDYTETMNYMVRFSTGRNFPIGFHDLPAYHDGSLAQSRDDLGTPLSAGCVRQWLPDARALWKFAPIGTRVVVTA